MRHKRRWLLVFVLLLAALAAASWPRLMEGVRVGGQKPADPFQIAGNLYYVGTTDITAFLLTGPQGHVLIGDGRQASAPMIMKSIARLGFRITDVKVLLNSHAHFDHAGALMALQQASGAQLWISEGDADVVAAGGAGDSSLGSLSFVSYLPFARYPPPRIDHRFKDGDTIRLGPIELTAHITPNHTAGSTTWSFPVHEGHRVLLAVSVCSLDPPLYAAGRGRTQYEKNRANFARTFETLRSLRADIFLASHARQFGRWRELQQRTTANSPADPFIDRAGYLAFINQWEAIGNEWLSKHQPEGK